jgi:hypothetical protein
LGIAAPIAAVFALVAVADPYNYFGWSKAVPDDLKLKCLYHDGRTMPFSNTLWKLLRFREQPMEDVLLGDSRLSRLDLDYLQQVAGQRYANLGIPGGNYRTITDLFNYSDSIAHLKEVVVQVSFRGMNKGMSDWDIYSEPRMLLDKPFLYPTNRRVLEATLLNLRGAVAPNSVKYDVLPPDHWQQVLKMERNNAANFHLDTSNFRRLQAIADRCRAEGAHLLFVEYPTHPEVQEIYAKAGQGPVFAQYMKRLSLIAPTIDLDAPSLFPPDRSLWRDPLHLTTAAQHTVVDMIWGKGDQVAAVRTCTRRGCSNHR